MSTSKKEKATADQTTADKGLQNELDNNLKNELENKSQETGERADDQPAEQQSETPTENQTENANTPVQDPGPVEQLPPVTDKVADAGKQSDESADKSKEEKGAKTETEKVKETKSEWPDVDPSVKKAPNKTHSANATGERSAEDKKVHSSE